MNNPHPSVYVCPNQNTAYECCSGRPPFNPRGPYTGSLGGYSALSRPGSEDYKVQMTKTWMGQACWAPEGFQCQCPRFVFQNKK